MTSESHQSTQNPAPHPPLRGVQKKTLRGLAMALKPDIVLGKNGLSNAVIRELNFQLEKEELIKVKLLGDRNERKATAAEIEKLTGAILAGLVGSAAAFYRQHPDPKKRRIALPK